MKIILIILTLFSINSYALEWNSNAFKQSMEKYKENIKEYVGNPKKIVNDVKSKYEPAVAIVKEGVENSEYLKLLETFGDVKEFTGSEEFKYYYNIFENKIKKYKGSANIKDAAQSITQDISNLIIWSYNKLDQVPAISPYKREVVSRVDFALNQLKANSITIPYRPQ